VAHLFSTVASSTRLYASTVFFKHDSRAQQGVDRQSDLMEAHGYLDLSHFAAQLLEYSCFGV
jgi:hypothetical protein